MPITQRAAGAIALSFMLLAGPAAGTALAGGRNARGSSVEVVLLDSTDGVAHYGQHVTFEVTTRATSKPFVSLHCYQGGEMVYWASAGFYPDYPWPWAQTFTLASDYWTGGAADCTAELYYWTGKRFVTLASQSFHVEA
jgi:hypothetical protein